MNYTQGSAEIDSSADVVESAAMAHNTARAGRSNAAAGCFKTQFQTGFAQQGVKTTGLTVTPEAVEVPGSDEVFAFHIVVTVAGPNGTVPSIPTSSTVAGGRSRSQSTTPSPAAARPPLTDAARLAGIAVHRVRASTG